MKKLLLAIVVLVIAAVGAVAWFVLRDDAPDPLALSEQSGEGGAFAADGTWSVGNGSEAGLRIQEEFLGGAATHTAVGRTDEVEGSMTIEGSEVTKGSVTVDLTGLTYSDTPPGLNVANRSNAMARAGLDTNNFPEATFELTEPIDLGAVPVPGRPVEATATGELTLHGVTNTIEVPVRAQAVNQTTPKIEVASARPVTVDLADYEIRPIENIGPVAKVADQGSFEFRLLLVQ